MIFKSGIGNEKLFPKYLYKDFFWDSAEHFEFARETASVAFAPKLVLFSLPSKSNKTLSIFFWSFESKSFNFLEILSLIFSTAIFTLFPKNLFLSLSLTSCASNAPVDAPDGEIAVAEILFSKKTSASTVGFPLLSKTCLPFIFLIYAIIILLSCQSL